MSRTKKQVPLEEGTNETKQEEILVENEELQESTDSEAEKTEEPADVKYLRLMADFQNYKRRVEKEKAAIYAYANEKIVSELLDVIDNFERALSHQGDEGSTVLEGMNKIYKQLRGVLEKTGLQEIEALGMDFDPNFHNAVMTEASEEYKHGKVSDVMQKGYILNNKVIRHTMVKVAE